MPESEPLLLTQFQYELPDDRIARFPLAQRDQSKLLVYRAGAIQHKSFSDLPGLLPEQSFLVFNNTKVIPARLHFTRTTGAVIELFLLNPVSEGDNDELPISQAMERTGSVVWHAMIGNRKRWKSAETLETTLTTPTGNVIVKADWYNQDASTVRLSWEPAELSFAQLIQFAGEIPLPPYLKRDATDADRLTYQTVYSKEEGAVAAPTAGLHFTDAVFAELTARGIGHDYVTLHVGAGTFQPIKSEDVRAHHMHTEEVVYTTENVRHLLAHLDYIIAVGTTSMRALESLYWMGVKLLQSEPDPFRLDQEYAYQWSVTERPAAEAALVAVLKYLTETSRSAVVAHTGIYITPGYQLAICRGIITNFHQPSSTLILLIATLIGDDWRTVYNEALTHDYRFLSYGDSSLLLP
ncbi:S-adenosylmethionine:tRNA ribosyltransferase-isomerase [Spirosoma sp. KUDC1026]|uniref:S-adenosylmethionine:tRNA ribosyltransferase-isomerase n=1 Tax=Spirosoma sp. KUDC1026 TaxID=2745947 RepID=UPI00159BCFFE|nr:S-adenosylmethionine:tRNA ribosyltransferase-isomerase [Spirosoma sp. KUDC1026]QKZ13296.1 S-adenosylmethionine:tRNA ribosyltransferase-isomerase [Spirosoma sp. KUDC1026]